MDTDTLSNCSVVSSESVSGLSIYQQEFDELKQLINPNCENCCTPKNDSSYYDISPCLQGTLNKNLFSLEKNIELKFHDNIENLLRKNKQLELELKSANKQIEKMFKQFTNIEDKKVVDLEQKCHNLLLQNFSLKTTLQQKNKEKDSLELLNQQLQTERSECKIILDVKNKCIKELKGKISEQFLETQNHLNSFKMSQYELKEKISELEQLQKSENWYKQQLYLNQIEKRTLLDDLLKCKVLISNQNEKIELLSMDLAHWQTKYDTSQFQILRDRKKLYDRITKLSEVTINVENKSNNEVHMDNSLEQSMSFYENTIQDLTNAITRTESRLNEQKEKVKNLIKENSNLLSAHLMLQKKLELKEHLCEQLENKIKWFHDKLTSMQEEDINKLKEKNTLQKHISNLECELLANNREKEAIESSIKIVRKQFIVFKNKYDELRNDLLERDKQILALQEENKQFSASCNQQVYELTQFKHMYEEMNSKFSSREEKIQCLECKLNEKENLCDVLLKQHQKVLIEIQKVETAASQYKTTAEKQIKDLQDLLSEKKVVIDEFQRQVSLLDADSRGLKEKESQLQASILNFKGVCKQQEKYKNLGIAAYKYLEKDASEINYLSVSDKQIQLVGHDRELQEKKYEELISANKQYTDTIEQLNILLQVNRLKIEEQRKRFEKNNRTLLKKIKEHMKGRNIAEKRIEYLQRLYDNLSEENTTLKLENNVMQHEILDLKKPLEQQLHVNNKLKSAVGGNLLANKTICEKCIENYEKLISTETEIKQLKIDLLDKTEAFNENCKHCNNLEDQLKVLKKQLEEKNILQQELNAVISSNNSTVFTDNVKLKDQLSKMDDKFVYLYKEIDFSNTALQSKAEELKCLENRLLKKEEIYKEQENIITGLKNYVHNLQIDNTTVNNEKYFLQRLCSDLKLALKSYVESNKVLKEKVEIMLKNGQGLTRLSIQEQNNITELIYKSKTSWKDQSYAVMQDCLNILREDISTLQKVIINKNTGTL